MTLKLANTTDQTVEHLCAWTSRILDCLPLPWGYKLWHRGSRPCLTCTTMTSESFCTGPNSSSFSTCCASLYRSMLRRMSEMLSGARPPFAPFWPPALAASLTLVPPSAWVLLRGFGVRNLCSTWKSLLCKYQRGYDVHRHEHNGVALHFEYQCTYVQMVATLSDTCRQYSVDLWAVGWAAYFYVINQLTDSDSQQLSYKMMTIYFTIRSSQMWRYVIG